MGRSSTVSRSPNLCDVYVRSIDDTLWQRANAAGQWLGWQHHDDGMPPDGRPGGQAPWRCLPSGVVFVYENARERAGRIELRTNDDIPGGGNVAFTCRVEIRRAKAPEPN